MSQSREAAAKLHFVSPFNFLILGMSLHTQPPSMQVFLNDQAPTRVQYFLDLLSVHCAGVVVLTIMAAVPVASKLVLSPLIDYFLVKKKLKINQHTFWTNGCILKEWFHFHYFWPLYQCWSNSNGRSRISQTGHRLESPTSLGGHQPIITARVRSMAEGHVFTGVCLFRWGDPISIP